MRKEKNPDEGINYYKLMGDSVKIVKVPALEWNLLAMKGAHCTNTWHNKYFMTDLYILRQI